MNITILSLFLQLLIGTLFYSFILLVYKQNDFLNFPKNNNTILNIRNYYLEKKEETKKKSITNHSFYIKINTLNELVNFKIIKYFNDFLFDSILPAFSTKKKTKVPFFLKIFIFIYNILSQFFLFSFIRNYFYNIYLKEFEKSISKKKSVVLWFTFLQSLNFWWVSFFINFINKKKKAGDLKLKADFPAFEQSFKNFSENNLLFIRNNYVLLILWYRYNEFINLKYLDLFFNKINNLFFSKYKKTLNFKYANSFILFWHSINQIFENSYTNLIEVWFYNAQKNATLLLKKENLNLYLKLKTSRNPYDTLYKNEYDFLLFWTTLNILINFNWVQEINHWLFEKKEKTFLFLNYKYSNTFLQSLNNIEFKFIFIYFFIREIFLINKINSFFYSIKSFYKKQIGEDQFKQLQDAKENKTFNILISEYNILYFYFFFVYIFNIKFKINTINFKIFSKENYIIFHTMEAFKLTNKILNISIVQKFNNFLNRFVVQTNFNSNGMNFFKSVVFGFSCFNFLFSLFFLIFSEQEDNYLFRYIVDLNGFLNTSVINLQFGVDNLSITLIILTAFLIPLCLLSAWDQISDQDFPFFVFLIFMIQLLLTLAFTALDVLLFYIFFESVLIPMYFLIGIWGSRERKMRAAFFFFLYTLLGSLFMLITIVILIFFTGTTNFSVLSHLIFSQNIQKILWIGFFLSFGIKVPIIPFHIWLPEAHVEAPTIGSMILAGLLLKLGTYGFLRFSLTIFSYGSVYYAPFVYVIGIVSIILASLCAIRQSDFKRIIAYSSVAHMNLVILGIFSFDIEGLNGAVLQMLSHGIVSSGLFFCIGVLYHRYHTRAVKDYSGVIHLMPLFISFFFILVMANISLPGTCNFVGEFLLFLGIFNYSPEGAILASLSLVLGGVYMLWLFNRISFANLKKNMYFISDLSAKETIVLFILTFFTIYIGIKPDWVSNFYISNIYYNLVSQEVSFLFSYLI